MSTYSASLDDLDPPEGDLARRLDEAEARVAALEEALAELHDYECGCENPGNPETCIARPVECYRHLAR